MADSSALTLVKEHNIGGVLLMREYTGTADDQASVAHSGPSKPLFYIIMDETDAEVGASINTPTSTNITYGAASSSTVRIFLFFDAQGSGGIS